MVKTILEWKSTASRWTERPRIRWVDDVCNDIKVMNVTVGKNRKAWDDLVEKANTHKGL
jgi:hypothetical protein